LYLIRWLFVVVFRFPCCILVLCSRCVLV
jgi:hypothetical protein